MSSDEPPFDFAPLDASAFAFDHSMSVCWKTIDPATAKREWPALIEWVHWLVGRYALTSRTVTPCWYRHGAVVEELSALRTGWLTAFSPDAPGSAPLDWHTMFAATRTRLEDAISRAGCSKDDHRDDQIPSWLFIDGSRGELS